MTAAVYDPPIPSTPDETRSSALASNRPRQDVRPSQPDPSSHQDASVEASNELPCIEGDERTPSQIESSGSIVPLWAALDSRTTKLLENDGIASSSPSKYSEVSDDQLPEQQWLRQNLKYIIRKLLPEWQGFRNQTNDHQYGQSQASEVSGLSQDGEGSQDSQKRKQDPGANDQEATSGPSYAPKRQKGAGEANFEAPLACPFSKKDLHVYRECIKFGFKRARDVKQHLKRNHSPEVVEPIRLCLQKPSTRGPREKQWYEVFDILFPGYLPRPSSPYNDFEISQQPPVVAAAVDEALNIPYRYLMTEGAGILLREITRDPAFSQQAGPDIIDMRRALGRLFGQYLN
ncbi:hypothetical protein ACHAPA_006407 [Fusarium lateritium]